METITNGYDETPSPALEALNAVASELPLKVILKLRPLYRAVGNDPSVQTNPDYHHISDAWLHCLDTALWRQQTHGH